MIKKNVLRDYLMKRNYLYDYNYIVNVGLQMFGFSQISNLSLISNVTAYVEGGGRLHLRSQKSDKENTEKLILKKGVTNMHLLDFASYYREGCYIKELMIIVLDQYKIPAKAFYFEEGIITNRTFSDLRGDSGDILKVTMEIEHTGLEEFTL